MEENDKRPRVVFVPREDLYPGIGLAVYRHNTAYVREDLPFRVKRFTVAHELYHLSDTRREDGPFWREFRANFYPALKDPLGLLACFWYNLTNPDKLRFY